MLLGIYMDFAWIDYESNFCLEDKRHDPTTTALRKYGWTFNPNVYRPKNNFITWLCAPRKIQPSLGTLFVPNPVLRKAWALWCMLTKNLLRLNLLVTFRIFKVCSLIKYYYKYVSTKVCLDYFQ